MVYFYIFISLQESEIIDSLRQSVHCGKLYGLSTAADSRIYEYLCQVQETTALKFQVNKQLNTRRGI